MELEQQVRLLRSDLNTLYLQLMVEKTITNMLFRGLQIVSGKSLERFLDPAAYPAMGRTGSEEDYLFEFQARLAELRKIHDAPIGDLSNTPKSAT